ncbi:MULTISPECIES: hypothetical protein [unclassified Streptomyces]|jgi:hypothetical protein|uniref:hypothetical protein n=1 Tax=unclassified Streptomyces TaxID=2593676 RepID=UPI00136FD00B|nr:MULTISPECIES: hypothetical protein [unclassified Streptomyces]MYQ86702.1 hypothetical protein [Streptomyces sp. SID4936]
MPLDYLRAVGDLDVEIAAGVAPVEVREIDFAEPGQVLLPLVGSRAAARLALICTRFDGTGPQRLEHMSDRVVIDELFGLRDPPGPNQAEVAVNDRFDVGLSRVLRPDLHREIVRVR